jgi:hypothetical protein
MSFQECSRTFQIPVRGVAQLAALQLLDLSADPIVKALHQDPQLQRESVSSLVGRLSALRRVPMPDEAVVALEDAFKGVGAQEKPWGPVLRAALERQISLYCDQALSAELHVSKLQISVGLAQQIAAGRRPDLLHVPDLSAYGFANVPMTRVETEAYLNCFPRDLSWLLAEGHLSADMAPAEIAGLGRMIISSREILWRWRVPPALREGLAKDHGIERSLGPFWPRAEVEEHFAKMLPKGGPR